MTLPRMDALVYLNEPGKPEPVEYAVTIRHVDRLKAEIQQRALGLDLELAQHSTTAWAWAAMVREGHYTGPCQRFLYDDCEGVDLAEDPDEVPPTPPDPPTDSP
jgi:hypothetical protein